MRESDEQFLARFLDEIEPSLDPIGYLAGLRLEEVAGGRRVRIVVSLVSRTGPLELVLEGESLLAAAAGWDARIAEARLALAFREVILTPQG